MKHNIGDLFAVHDTPIAPVRTILGYLPNGRPVYQLAGGRQNTHRVEADRLKAQILAIRDSVPADGDLSDEQYGEVVTLKAQFDDADAKAARIEGGQSALDELARPKADNPERGLDDEQRDLPYGEAFVKSAAFQSFIKAHPSGVSGPTPFQIDAHLGKMGQLFSKATIGLETGGSPASTFQNPQRVGTIDYLPREDTGILDLISRAQMTTNLIEYLQIISVTEGAAIVAPGALKPLSDFDTSLADARAYTYADGFAVTNQSLSDEGFLASYLQARLPRHLRNELQRVLLAGSGVGGEPTGILTTSGIQTQAFDTSAPTHATQLIDTFSYALEKADNADADVSAIALNPTDYWSLLRLRDAENKYYSNGPWSGGPNTIWGVPLRKVRRIPVGTALTGEFSTITLLDREGVSVQAFNQHEDYARRNLTYVRAELRAGLAVFEPAKLVKINLVDATP